MGNILDTIVATKRKEVELAKEARPLSLLEKQIERSNHVGNSLSEALKARPGIISEFKRASPSKGVINGNVEVEEIVKGYAKNGALGISVLTDQTYFQARPDDFVKARQSTSKPLLRKEFIVDEYQLVESKAMEANIVLLIAAVLTQKQIKDFTQKAHDLGLEVLLELHDKNEVSKVCGLEDMIGVNNRNLKTFEVDIHQSLLVKHALSSPDTPMISESGLSGINELKYLAIEGFRGFLMGEHFMKHKDPVGTFENLMREFETEVVQ